MSYESIRPYIQDGDLIAFKTPSGVFPRLIRLFTGKPYTHLAGALWLDDGLWIAEMDGLKNVLVPLSQYAKIPFSVFTCPVSDREAVRSQLLEGLREHITYDWMDIVRLGLYFLFRVPLPKENDSLQCASWMARAYARSGWEPALKLPSIPWPGIVVEALGAKPSFENTP